MKDALKYATLLFIYLTHLLPTAPVEAYVLKSGHILQLMAAEQGETKHLKINQRLTVFDPFAESGTIVLPETVQYSFPTRFRSDINAESIQRIHVAAGQAALTVIDNRIVSDTGSRFDLYKDLLLMRSRPLLEKYLVAQGIDIRITSVGRYNDMLAFIIGAQYPDDSVSQVWVDKVTFRPLRWLIKTDEPLIREFEVRYLQWQAIGDGWYPWKIEFYENQMLVRQIEVRLVSPEQAIASEVYNVPVLRQQFAEAISSREPVDEPRENEVQDTIDSFKKRFK